MTGYDKTSYKPLHKLLGCQCGELRYKKSKKRGVFKVYEMGYYDDKGKVVNKLKLKCVSCGYEREIPILKTPQRQKKIIFDY